MHLMCSENHMNFKDQVKEVVRDIPEGEVRTYGEVAEAIGRPGAARAVGTIMKNNFDTGVPCHRVIRADGTVGDYNRGGRDRKLALLRAEGVSI